MSDNDESWPEYQAQLEASKADDYARIDVKAPEGPYYIICIQDSSGNMLACIDEKFVTSFPNGDDKIPEATKLFWGSVVFHGKTLDMQIKELEAKLDIAQKALEVIVELENLGECCSAYAKDVLGQLK